MRYSFSKISLLLVITAGALREITVSESADKYISFFNKINAQILSDIVSLRTVNTKKSVLQMRGM
jgi:hypothetical protein